MSSRKIPKKQFSKSFQRLRVQLMNRKCSNIIFDVRDNYDFLVICLHYFILMFLPYMHIKDFKYCKVKIVKYFGVWILL